MSLRWHLKEIADLKGVTGYRLAEMTGISRQTIYKLMRADFPPRLQMETLGALCKALECQPGDLMDAPDIPPRRKRR